MARAEFSAEGERDIRRRQQRNNAQQRSFEISLRGTDSRSLIFHPALVSSNASADLRVCFDTTPAVMLMTVCW